MSEIKHPPYYRSTQALAYRPSLGHEDSTYDHLFADGPQKFELIGDAIHVKERVEPFTERERAVFAPPEAENDAPREEETDYSGLWSDDYEPSIDPRSAAVEHGGSKRSVTPESQRDAQTALFRLLEHDTRAAEIIRAVAGNVPLADVVDVLRQDADLRVAIGRYFLDKLDAMPHLPERVARSLDAPESKTAQYPGYKGKMSSGEYVALLGLSMLDGTFRKDKEDSDEASLNARLGETRTGQHRKAARELLSTHVQNRTLTN